MTETTREAEQALVGACLLGPPMLDVVSDVVTARDFADAALGSMYAMLQDMHSAGEPVGDVVFVARRLRHAGLFEKLGGNVGLAELTKAVGNACHAPQYAAEVKRAASLRRLRILGHMVVEQSEEPEACPADLAQRIDAELQGIAQHTVTSKTRTLAEAASEALADIDAARQSAKRPGLPTGLWRIDETLGGMYPGDLVILAARPSIGKSALGAQIAAYNAGRERPVLFVSLEMKATDIALRSISGEIGVSVQLLRAARLTASDLQEANAFSESLSSLPFHIWTGRGATVAKIRSAARVQQATGGLDMLVVDYLGLMAATDRRKPRWEQITEVSADLKSLALELEVPVLALCQLSREAEKGTPRLDHLRDAGAIEQDADAVLLLHRETRDATAAVLDIAKARNGETGTVPIGFDPERVRFIDDLELVR